MKSIPETVELIQRLHTGQKHWDGTDYAEHPVEVMNLLPPDSTHQEKLAALLHGTIETGAATPEQLKAFGYEDEIIEMIVLQAHQAGEINSYNGYLLKMCQIVESGNRGAMRVKLADNISNSAMPGRDYSVSMAILRAGLRLVETRGAQKVTG